MNTLFTLETLTLFSWALGEIPLNSWNKSPIALKKNGIASSYINTLDICPQEVPRCPGKAEPRCIQDPSSGHTGPPTRGNTQWRCVLCEDNPEGTACFMVIPIETYDTMKPPPNQKGTGATKSKRLSGGGNINRTTTSSVGQNGAQPPKALELGQSPWPQPQVQQLGIPNLQNGPPLTIPQLRQNIDYLQPNIKYQQPYAPPNYGYQQRPYLPYGQYPSYGQQMLNPFNMYLPQTNPYMQPLLYNVPLQYPNDPQLPNNYLQ